MSSIESIIGSMKASTLKQTDLYRTNDQPVSIKIKYLLVVLMFFCTYAGIAQTTNIALNKTTTVSSTESSSYLGPNAVDGNTGTRWSSAFSDPQWIYVDLGAVYSINRVKLVWEAAYAASYRIQTSLNGTDWTTIASRTNATGLAAPLVNDLTGLKGSGQYIRMYGVTRATSYGYSLWEFEVYGFINLALNKSAMSSSNESTSLTASNAFDGKDNPYLTTTGTRWSSAQLPYSDETPQWIYVNLGGSYILREVKINWEAAYASDYQLQVSSDATNWTTIRTITSNTAQINNLTGLAGAGQYVRMYGTKRGNNAYGYSIYEMEVDGTPNTAPTVSISSPANGTVYTAPSTFTLSANASDAENNLAKVEFYSGNNLLGTDATSPYSIGINAVTPGTFSLTAKAYDVGGLVTTSAPITVYINPAAPTVTGAARCGAGSVTLSAAGTPAGGTYNWYTVASGGTAIAGATAATYTTPSLNATTTYYVSYTSGGRESTRTAVTATINPNPIISSMPATGLLDSYLFSGNANDATGGNNNGTIQGTVIPATGRYGNGNSAYSFNGSSGHITTTLQYTNPQTFSLSMWFNTTVAGGKLIGFSSTQAANGSQKDRHIYMNNTGQLYFGVWPSTNKVVSTPSAYNDGRWHHVVATFSGTNGMRLYVDGLLQASDATVKSAEVYNGYWHIGYGNLINWTSEPSNYYFNGLLDDVAIYDREITASEVANLNGAGANPNPVCAGSTLNLTANTVTGATYSWTGPNGFTSAAQNPSIASVTAAAAGTYTVTVTANGCTSQASVMVAVNPTPTAPVAQGASRCGPGTVTLAASGTPTGGSYNWYAASTGGTSLATTASYTTLSLTATTTYYVAAVSSAGCESPRTAVTATVNQATTPTITASGPTTFCAGGSVVLTASTASSYQWSTGATTQSITVSASGNYTVTITDANSCQATSAATAVTVNALPAAPTAADVARCGSGTVDLVASGSSGSYRWYDAATNGTLLSSTATYRPTVNATTPYYVAAVSSAGCEGPRKAVTATINSVIISSTPTGTNWITSYPFTGNTNDASGNGNNGTIQGGVTPATGRYGNSNNAYNFNGSTGYISTTTLYTGPNNLTVSIWFNTTVGGGKLIGLETQQTGLSEHYDRNIYMNNSGQLYFAVFPGRQYFAKTTAAYNDGKWHHVVGTLSTTNGLKLYVDGALQAQEPNALAGQNISGYWRIGQGRLQYWPEEPANSFFQGLLDDVNIYNRELTATEVANLNGAGAAPVCAGNTISLTANTVSGATYSWTGPNGFTSDVQNPFIPNASMAASGTYTVTVSANGCSSEALVAAVVNPVSTATFTASPTTLYSGENSTLTFTGTVVADAVYNWNFDGGSIVSGAGAGPYQVKWDTPGTKNVTLSVSANGCTSATQTVPVTVNGNYIWNGSVSADWNDAANWAPNGVPGVNDRVTIVNTFNNAPVNNLPVVNTNTTVKDFKINSGTLNLNGKTLTISGIADFDAGRVENGMVDIQCNQVTFKGTTFTAAVNTVCDNIYLNGSVFHNAATITKEGPGTTDNESNGGSIFNGPATIINNTNSRMRLGTTTGDTFAGDVTFTNQASGTMEISYNSASAFGGNITVNSSSVVTFGAGTGSAVLNGTSDQNISKTGTAAMAFNRLAVNKSAGNTLLQTPVTISAGLTLTQGNIISSAGNLLVFGAGATVTGAKHTSYVEGPVKRFGPDAFTFPVGKTNFYRPIGINPNGDATGAFTAEYFPVNPATAGSPTSKDATINHLSSCEYWQLDRVAGTASSPVMLSWDTNSCGVDVPADLLIGHWDGTKWVNAGSSSVTGNNTAGTVTSSGSFATFSPFTLGSSSTNNPLPVELLTFKATDQTEKVLLEWATASEEDNKGFEVQRSTNGIDFVGLAFVAGAGNSRLLNNYTSYDRSPLSGTSYYRLKQVDYSGKTEYSKIVSVSRNTISTWVRVGPNPVLTKTIVYLHLPSPQACIIRLADVTGRILYSQKLDAVTSDKVSLDLTGYAKGTYMLTVLGSGKIIYTGKLLKN